MVQKRYMGKAIVALCVTAALLVSACFLGQSQARYENYSQWRSVYAPETAQLTSDRLTPEGQTVLLKDWNVGTTTSRMKGIAFCVSSGSVIGNITCSVDQPEYLTAATDKAALTVNTTGVDTQLTMTLTEAALLLTQQVTATVRVSFIPEGGEEPALWADYQVKLLPQEETAETEELPAEEAEPAPEPADLTVNYPETFAWTERLALRIAIPDQSDELILGMNGGNFPEGTRYILNGAAFLLGDDMPIQSAAQGGQMQDLLLDFSLLTRQDDTLTLQAQTMYQQEVTAASEITVATTRAALEVDASELNPVITGNAQLQLPISQDDGELTWRLEMLTQGPDGIAYTRSDEQFYLVTTLSEETDESGTRKFITISNANNMAPAGTYRLTVERLQEELPIRSIEVQFFVCY